LLAVPCTFSVSLDGELTIKRSLPDDFLSERLELSQAITKALAFPPSPDNRSLSDFAELFDDPSFRSFIQSDGSFELSSCLAKIVRADNANPNTRPIVGSLHLEKNLKLLETWIASLTLDPGEAPTLYWIAPGRTILGAIQAHETIDHVSQENDRAGIGQGFPNAQRQD
jgi:hypothetical protein